MITETRAAPVLEGAYGQLAHMDEPFDGQKDVVDMIGRTVLRAVAPIKGSVPIPDLAARLAMRGTRWPGLIAPKWQRRWRD